MITKEQAEEFSTLSRPLIKWLNDNQSPHSQIVIDSTSAALFSGQLTINTTEFVKD